MTGCSVPRGLMRAGLLAVCVALLGACGVGAVEETTFIYGAMDADGGTLDVGDITLTIPKGALGGPTAVAVLPEVAPLPIMPPPGDTCTYTVLGSQWCCGPVGLDLLMDGSLVVRYDPSLIVAPLTEADLVLLLWDDGLGALVPAPTTVVHEPAMDRFVVSDYSTLGHLAVGVRDCPLPQIVFLGFGGPANPVLAAKPRTDGLYVVPSDGSTPPDLLPTGAVPFSFLGSPDGRRVMFELGIFEEDSESETREIWTYTLGDAASVRVAGQDEEIVEQDPTLGWMRDAQRIFFQQYLQPQFVDQTAVFSDTYAFTTAPADGAAPASVLYEIGDTFFVDDVRQSPDGRLVLVRYLSNFEEDVVDVFDAATGAPLSQGLIPVSSWGVTPRFLPDSSGLYVVTGEGGNEVHTFAPDGTGETTIFTAPAAEGILKDFVLAPNGDDFVYIAVQFQTTLPTQSLAVPGQDAAYFGSLSGGAGPIVDLGVTTSYEDVVIHPAGQHVYVDPWSGDVRCFVLATGAETLFLPIRGLSDLDINSVDGTLLLTLYDFGDSISNDLSETMPPGVYLAQPDGSNPVLVPTGDGTVPVARWMTSVRTAPGMSRTDRFR